MSIEQATEAGPAVAERQDQKRLGKSQGDGEGVRFGQGGSESADQL